MHLHTSLTPPECHTFMRLSIITPCTCTCWYMHLQLCTWSCSFLPNDVAIAGSSAHHLSSKRMRHTSVLGLCLCLQSCCFEVRSHTPNVQPNDPASPPSVKLVKIDRPCASHNDSRDGAKPDLGTHRAGSIDHHTYTTTPKHAGIWQR